MKRDFNPMSGKPTNLTAGSHTSGKVGGAANPSGGAGRQMGPGIARGFLISGTGSTYKTGGKFASANSAKKTKRAKSRKG